MNLHDKILVWDHDGTIKGSRDPRDTSSEAKVILPHVAETMAQASLNVVISGIKTPESEAQDFDPSHVAQRFMGLMDQLPIQAVAFSPLRGGVACYALVRQENNQVLLHKAHEEERYKMYGGHFKKPGIGMFVVMRDLLRERFGRQLAPDTALMIGDTWHDQEAALAFGIPFLEAWQIHQRKI